MSISYYAELVLGAKVDPKEMYTESTTGGVSLP
jgi:hypothetical protein